MRFEHARKVLEILTLEYLAFNDTELETLENYVIGNQFGQLIHLQNEVERLTKLVEALQEKNHDASSTT